MFYQSSKYNYTEWNRIENKINELWDRVYIIDPSIPALTSKTDWDNTDFPFVEELDRIKGNIRLLAEYYIFPYDYIELELDKIYFDYREANKLELDLIAIENVLDRAYLRFSGESYSGEGVWL